MKLASGEMPEQLLREIADQVYAADATLADAARADIVAVYDRDPACHRMIQPVLYFKGFQAVQAYRIGHWLWTEGRHDLAYFLQMRISEVFGVDIHPDAAGRQGADDRPCPFDRHRRDGGGRRQRVDAAFGDAGRHRQGRSRPPSQGRRWRADRRRGRRCWATSRSATARGSRRGRWCCTTCRPARPWQGCRRRSSARPGVRSRR